MFRKIAFLLIAPLAAIGIGAAVPAMASTACSGPACTVNVTVESSLSITGLTDVAFDTNNGTIQTNGSTAIPGCPAATPVCGGSTPAENYFVSSNSGTGYTLTETAGQAAFTSTTTSVTIPDTDWFIQTSAGATLGGTIVKSSFNPSTSPAQIVKTTSGPTSGSGDEYVESWVLSLPGSVPSGTFTGTLTYAVVSN